MLRLRRRTWRQTRTAGILPALISRYTVRRLTCRYSRTSSVVRNVSSIMRSLSRLHGQFDGEDRSALWVVAGDDVAAMFLHNPVRNRQSQPRPLADFLRR